MIYLASQSPRRKELLALIFDDFKVMPVNANETVPCEISADETAEYLSSVKANALCDSVAIGDVVIGADTVVILDGEIFGKPADKKDAFSMLKKLSGKTHKVVTGVTVIRKDNVGKTVKSFSCSTDVKFNNMTDSEIEGYIASNEPMDKAGAYGIQGKGSRFVEYINGDYFNVVGLPVSKLYNTLKSMNDIPEV